VRWNSTMEINLRKAIISTDGSIYFVGDKILGGTIRSITLMTEAYDNDCRFSMINGFEGHFEIDKSTRYNKDIKRYYNKDAKTLTPDWLINESIICKDIISLTVKKPFRKPEKIIGKLMYIHKAEQYLILDTSHYNFGYETKIKFKYIQNIEKEK